MEDSGQHSTLEVANQHNVPPEYAHGLEAVPPHSDLPQVVEGNDLPDAKPESHAFLDAGHPAPYDGERKIWGLKRRTFMILAALVALVVVGAVVGGAVGGTVGKSKSSSTPSSTSGSPTTTSGAPTSTSTAAPVVLSNSSLSSANWTDLNGNTHHAVFWQGASNSLRLSLWDSQNTTWAVHNVSAPLNSSFAALPGTPLAAAISSPPNFQLNLYYLSPSNQIIELYTVDTQGGDWKIGSLHTYNLQAGAGSRLASYWQICEYQCSQAVILLYEDNQQNVLLANSSHWGATSSPFSGNVNTNSGLAIVPLAPIADINTQPYQLRAYIDVSQASQEILWDGYVSEGVWSTASALPHLPLSSPPPQFAAASFGTVNQGFFASMLVFLFPNGTISANWWDNTNWHTYITPSPNMPQSNFTAIAMNQDLRFYGISSGAIYEYSIDGSNPFDWSYVNPVNTTSTSH
ncbi:hypothetical protein EG329_001916 [Mollisiaceae sp. DMI_Dod_QoI]|nr:hypothetical protein EG329_001916 [Helotiales sp. DMI_Dod_QoI]